MAYDNNGLPLSPVAASAKSNNAYLYAHMDWTHRVYVARTPIHHNRVTRTPQAYLGTYDDARDAAYVAMSFAELYPKDVATEMYMAGTFNDAAREFLENLEIPEWQYPSEQISFDEYENIEVAGYTTNRVEDARAAIVEAIKLFGVKTPKLEESKKMIARVEEMVKAGTHNLRQAAKVVLGV